MKEFVNIGMIGVSGRGSGMLRELKVGIVCREGIHQKYAIMDGSTVWYGSINLLSFSTSQESIMRLHSSSIARALMHTEEGEKS